MSEHPTPAARLSCPCGESISGRDDDDLVTRTQAHLEQAHSGRTYTRDEILFMAL